MQCESKMHITLKIYHTMCRCTVAAVSPPKSIIVCVLELTKYKTNISNIVNKPLMPHAI